MPYIIITGAAGFLGSHLCDRFLANTKIHNWTGLKYFEKINRDDLSDFLNGDVEILAFVHLGARTDTLELDYEVHRKLNVEYSKMIWDFCTERKIPLVYASSAATYGDGSLGYSDAPELIQSLKPLNPYGRSKNDFDLWSIENPRAPKNWVGLKFFNV